MHSIMCLRRHRHRNALHCYFSHCSCCCRLLVVGVRLCHCCCVVAGIDCVLLPPCRCCARSTTARQRCCGCAHMHAHARTCMRRWCTSAACARARWSIQRACTYCMCCRSGAVHSNAAGQQRARQQSCRCAHTHTRAAAVMLRKRQTRTCALEHSACATHMPSCCMCCRAGAVRALQQAIQRCCGCARTHARTRMH
jgi:hypothetical protein